MSHAKTSGAKIDRRAFLGAAAAGGAAVLLGGGARRSRAQAAPADLNVAILGIGTQGLVLLRDALRIPGVKFRAVCDLWKFSQRYGAGTIRKYKDQPRPNVYEDYREMLAAEKDLDACIVATPDWMHAEHAVAAMKAGLHVYCEKEMSPGLDLAAGMVRASRQTGRMLQIGHQRRSNPVYLWARKLIREESLLGRMRSCHGQWNRAGAPKRTCPEQHAVPEETLRKYGYGSMDELLNWRWYRKYSAGPIADLGSHQIDIFGWYLGVEPHSVQAVGGADYWPDRQWYEDVMCLYEYKPKAAPSVRAFYQVQSTNGFGHYFERFMGDAGTLTVSEDHRRCHFVPEPGRTLPDWMAGVEAIDVEGAKAVPLVPALQKKSAVAARDMETWKATNIHQFHLMNFFGAVRSGDAGKLSCPAEVGYPTAVAVLNVVPAIEKGAKVELDEKAYKV
ncbi:MAG TPA: Gfo/Idh/MocA family oxidoreductase [Phycisphaerae bacterium]|nr:Gfo/Idh/MocA family oxidoreductase [Phycisphaerae bacterium]